ncbi:MAG TPA: hypothetical protein VIB38_14715, partial [Aestuariivirgaceae bacterium]
MKAAVLAALVCAALSMGEKVLAQEVADPASVVVASDETSRATDSPGATSGKNKAAEPDISSTQAAGGEALSSSSATSLASETTVTSTEDSSASGLLETFAAPMNAAHNGSFTYSIDLNEPDFRGLEPDIKLDYDSSQGIATRVKQERTSLVNSAIEKIQKEVCARFGAHFVKAPPDLKIGLAKGVWEGAEPINGLRHPPEGDTTGWYVLAGTEWSYDPDFFEPVHIGHLLESGFDFVKYLGLGP